MFVHGHLQGLRRNFIRIYRWRPRIKTIPRDILPSSLVSKDELKAIIAPDAIPTAAPASSRSASLSDQRKALIYKKKGAVCGRFKGLAEVFSRRNKDSKREAIARAHTELKPVQIVQAVQSLSFDSASLRSGQALRSKCWPAAGLELILSKMILASKPLIVKGMLRKGGVMSALL